MDIAFENHGEKSVIRLGGLSRFSSPAAEKVKARFMNILESTDNSKFLVDMSEVEGIDSSGISALITLFREVRNRQGAMLLCGVKNSVKIVLELTRLNEIFEFSASVEAAI